MNFSPPILLIANQRPIHTKKVVDSLKNIGLSKLYVFVDAPSGDLASQERHSEVVSIFEQNFFPFELELKVSSVNLGCGKGPVSAIDWAFKSTDELIILEDDIVASKYFYDYMTKCLEGFREDHQCMMVSSNKYDRFPQFKKIVKTPFSFTNGWGTWKRAWDKYKFYFEDADFYYIESLVKNNTYPGIFRKEWKVALDELRSLRQLSFWDYQWQIIMWMNKGYSIQPPWNLTENIGFDELATHTVSSQDWRLEIKIDSRPVLITKPKKIGRLFKLYQMLFRSSFPSYIYRKTGFRI